MLELHTERLLLRDFVEGDWPLIYALSCESAVTRYQSWLRVPDEARARQWVRDAIDHNRRTPRRAYSMALVERASHEPIGWLGYGLREGYEHSYFSFGYALLPRLWGHGYMTEAVRAALKYMFETLGAQHVQAECAASNPGSARVMEKAGLRFIRRYPGHDAELNISEDSLLYAIMLPEWQAAAKQQQE